MRRRAAWLWAPPMVRRTIGAAESKRIAAGQRWKCNACGELLPSAYEIDHIVALADGGSDVVDAGNLQALCPNCHADKTQRERITRAAAAGSVDRLALYETRSDTFKDGVATCTLCWQTRPESAPHPVCWKLEARVGTAPARAPAVLAQFAYTPWTHPLE